MRRMMISALVTLALVMLTIGGTVADGWPPFPGP